MQAVILAGGLGTRLRPLTYHIPKPMVQINNKPFLEHQLELLKKNDVCNVLLCVGYLGKRIEEYFKDGKDLGLNISYSYEKELLGTGGAIKNAEEFVENEFMILNGDTFLDISYRSLIDYFKENKKLGVMVVFNNKEKNIQNNTKINDKKEVLNYNKTEEGESNTIDAGVQIFKKDILKFIPDNRKVSLEQEIFPVLIEKRELLAFPTDELFYDIGTLERLQRFKKIS